MWKRVICERTTYVCVCVQVGVGRRGWEKFLRCTVGRAQRANSDLEHWGIHQHCAHGHLDSQTNLTPPCHLYRRNRATCEAGEHAWLEMRMCSTLDLCPCCSVPRRDWEAPGHYHSGHRADHLRLGLRRRLVRCSEQHVPLARHHLRYAHVRCG